MQAISVCTFVNLTLCQHITHSVSTCTHPIPCLVMTSVRE